MIPLINFEENVMKVNLFVVLKASSHVSDDLLLLCRPTATRLLSTNMFFAGHEGLFSSTLSKSANATAVHYSVTNDLLLHCYLATTVNCNSTTATLLLLHCCFVIANMLF